MKEKKNKKKTITIILICVAAVLLYAAPYIFAGIILLLDTGYIDYKIENNSIVLDDNYAIISNMNGRYVEKDNCYVIEYTIDNKKYDNDNLDIVFDVYDSDGYILGQAVNNIDLDMNKKYKTKSSFCDEYSKNVSKYKIKYIDSY